MSNEKIRKGFETRLELWANVAGFKVAYENDSFEEDVNKTYLEIFLLPAQTTSQYLEDTDRNYEGFAQININMPLNEGTGDKASIVSALDIIYATSFVQDGLTIFTQPLSELPGQREDNFFKVPVRIIYRAMW